MPAPEFLSAKEFAQLHGLHDSRVRRLLLDGRLPAFKVGNQWVIPVDTQPPPDKRVKSGAYKDWRKKDLPPGD